MEFLKKLKESLDKGEVFNTDDIDKINQITELSKKYDNKVRNHVNSADFQNSLDFGEKNNDFQKNNEVLEKIKFIMSIDDDLMNSLKELEKFLNQLNGDKEIENIPDYIYVKKILDEFNGKYNFRKNGNVNIKFN